MRLLIIWRYLVIVGVVILVSCAPMEAAQAVKATLASTSLQRTTFQQWLQDLGYQRDQIYPLTVASTGCPLVQADISGAKLSLLLDTGTARGFVITNNAPPVAYHILERTEELNADGSHRGESFRIRLDSLSVLGRHFTEVTGSLTDWRMFSSEPFDGTLGLDFFLDRRITLDYRSLKVGVTSAAISTALDSTRYISLDLVQPPGSQGNILYARGKVNGRNAIIYFDTGYSVSFIDPGFAEGLRRVERPGKYKVFRDAVPVELGGRRFVLNELREDTITRGRGFDSPVALALGSDVLSHFIVTVDIGSKRLILGVQK